LTEEGGQPHMRTLTLEKKALYTPCNEGWTGSSTVLDLLGKIKSLVPAEISTPDIHPTTPSL